MDLLATNFIVTGSEAAAAAAEIQKIISEKFHCPVPAPSEEDTEAGKAQVVEIPGGPVLAINHLGDKFTERMEKKLKLDNMMEKIHRDVIDQREISVKIRYPNSNMLNELEEVDGFDLVDRHMYLD